MDENYIYGQIAQLSNIACKHMNKFSSQILKTRGGRIGNGMGSLLEALWGFMMNQIILEKTDLDCEIAWFPDNKYNDFACIRRDTVWDPETRAGEYFRIEAKSMNIGADESKAHFAALDSEIEPNDALLILIWEWRNIDTVYSSPIVVDSFFDRAKGVAELRDKLHIERGGTFVDSMQCPDGCSQIPCKHSGEPLNAKGKRERLSGPNMTRPSLKVSHAANFGGLVRMLKTVNSHARSVLRDIRRCNVVADNYITFIHTNFPTEEKNQYTIKELKAVASRLGIEHLDGNKDVLYKKIRSREGYQSELKKV